MYEDQISIYDHLKANPAKYYITPSGEQLYLFVKENVMMCLVGADFSKMSEAEINVYVVTYI